LNEKKCFYQQNIIETFLNPGKSYIIPGNEKMALCDSQYSKISPLSGGEIIFATLGNRPSNEHFENSKVLQVSFSFISYVQINVQIRMLSIYLLLVMGDLDRIR